MANYHHPKFILSAGLAGSLLTDAQLAILIEGICDLGPRSALGVIREILPPEAQRSGIILQVALEAEPESIASAMHDVAATYLGFVITEKGDAGVPNVIQTLASRINDITLAVVRPVNLTNVRVRHSLPVKPADFAANVSPASLFAAVGLTPAAVGDGFVGLVPLHRATRGGLSGALPVDEATGDAPTAAAQKAPDAARPLSNVLK